MITSEKIMKSDMAQKTRSQHWLRIVLHLAALLFFAALCSHGFQDRINLLLEAERPLTLVFYVGVWGVSLSVLLIAALQPNSLMRAFWALLISLSSAAAFGYRMISSSDLSVFDILSLWTVRHEAGAAMTFYQDAGLWSVLIFVICFFLIYSVPVLPGKKINMALKWLGWAPAIPIGLIAAIIVLRSGGGSQSLPWQFQPLAVTSVAAFKISSLHHLPRRQVEITPTSQKPVSSIVLLVDESLRADYLNWKPGNPYTPRLAANREHFINFGHAVSGGNCSSYSNAILRMGPMRRDIPGTIRVNPTLWQYAKKAGFRTVYIDGQSSRIKEAGKLQNFMTTDEARFIDQHVTFDADVPETELDDRVQEIIKQELSGERLVFIYANREGAHFPYDKNYPADHEVFKPTMRVADSLTARVNSYRNVVAWSVDRLISRLHIDLDLSDAALIYTSDHGQNFPSGEMTHCSTKNANPREGLVPLLVMTGNQALKDRFAAGANLNWNRANHFAIAATMIELMGYRPQDVARHHDPSLFAAQGGQNPAFTSGDIFGIFSNQVTWNRIDPNEVLLEPEAVAPVTLAASGHG